MASPMPTQPTGGWSNHGQAMPSPNDHDESGVQVRPVGLKVLYKFNRDEKFDCLARPPQTFTVQTIPIDETTTIGVIDLRLCIQAVIECSPELPGRDCDFTIYAHDYSEPDTPLVGQGMLSAALSSLQHDMGGQAKMVTGLVTRNKLGLLMGNANKETLEVKLKFTETPRTHQHQPQPQQQQQQHMQYHQHHLPPVSHSQSQPDMYQPPRTADRAMTPTGTAEWNSFMQSNPQIGQSASFSRGVSPALSQGPPQMVHERAESFVQAPQPHSMPPQELPRIAPVPIEPPSDINGQGPSSRPSSRASNKAPSRKRPTGRPRGRPRKKPLEGNTSGYEDGTEGEDGPAKKRVKTTKVDRASANPFGTEPESLRVAASTSGSIRSFRPVGLTQEATGASHLQEVPRAPTPVPNGPFPGGRRANKGGPRRESAMNREISAKPPSPQSQRMRPLSPSQEDGRSPESAAQTPAFSDDSPADIGSSPPVPRTTSFMQSSPPPSSPMLPPMPQQQISQDDGLENDEMSGLFGEEQVQPAPVEKIAAPAPVRKNKIGPRRSSSNIPMQIFRMEDGPDGQDMVHLCSFNAPEPNAKKMRPLKPKPHFPPAHTGPPFPPPSAFAAPTPPQTTDTMEKPTSPPLPENQPEAPLQQALPLGPEVQQLPAPQPYFAPLPENSEPTQQPSVESNEPSENPVTVPNPQPPVDQTQAKEPTESKTNENAPPKPKNSKPRPKPRKLARSQSAGPLALPTAPASEPAGPSSLSQSTTIDAGPPSAAAPPNLRRATSSGPLNVPVPASDPIGPAPSTRQAPMLALPQPVLPHSDAVPPAPSSPQGPRSNKNIVKKNAIEQKLEAAIKRGEMPPYCSNCGAIQTPTWRKIYGQEHQGAPPHYETGEFSAKPGMVTTVEILGRDSEEKPTSYRLVKKMLGPEEDRSEWQEHLLCNPCGIWLGKCFSHRPPGRWEEDAARLGRERKKRSGESGANSRTKKPRGKSANRVNPTSEAYLPTDAPGSTEPLSPKGAAGLASIDQPNSQGEATQASGPKDLGFAGVRHAESGPRSTHSSGSGGAKSPIDLELDAAMGSTKRLLFPSPRKDSSPKVLNNVDVNIVLTDTECRPRKDILAEKENLPIPQTGITAEADELENLFRSPLPPRPSTPPSKARTDVPTTPFKTPTRVTPSHRPITRSVSRSIRSKDSLASPVADFKRTPSRTPSRTPRADLAFLGSASKRRSPRNHGGIDFDDSIFDTPVSRAVNQMLSEPNFGLDDEMELVSLGAVDTDPNWVNFSSFFSTDAPMPSSPPKDRVAFGADQATDMWDWSIEQITEVNK
ncbi:hypothetical protein ACO1O0_009020 [Amphichorda felina]